MDRFRNVVSIFISGLDTAHRRRRNVSRSCTRRRLSGGVQIAYPAARRIVVGGGGRAEEAAEVHNKREVSICVSKRPKASVEEMETNRMLTNARGF